MDTPPLSLTFLRLTPHTLIPSDDPPEPSPVPIATDPLPTSSLPPTFSPSPTHNYPSPFGVISLGSTLSVHARLTNTRPDGGQVLGVKMMIEIQGPGGRYRLGEVIHGGATSAKEKTETPETEVAEKGEALPPALLKGEFAELEVGNEMKELGIHVLICSVAWETSDGRRTFQRFLKFNVNAPLAIKTRIVTSQDPNISLDPARRQDVSLEVLVQNFSTEGLVFDKVHLEAVQGLSSRPIGSPNDATLMPGDTRQYLFVLSPHAPASPPSLTRSVLPPSHVGGTILPLGRLDVAWLSGPYRDSGRLQTSTLNRRVPVPAIAPKPTRTLSAAPPSPAGLARSVPLPPNPTRVEDEVDRWEFDLAVMEGERDGVEVEKEFLIKLRLAVRDTTPFEGDEDAGKTIPPRPLKLGMQYLTQPPPSRLVPPPLQPPTPMSPASSRPFSPLTPSTPGAGPSRPMSPVSTQLRQATSQNITSPSTSLYLPSLPPLPLPLQAPSTFPPRPFLGKQPSHHAKRLPLQTMLTGEIAHLGVSLIILETKDFNLVTEDLGVTYTDTVSPPRYWEAVHECELRFIALQEGMAELGGLRVLEMDDHGPGGSVGREWESLGDVWVDG